MSMVFRSRDHEGRAKSCGVSPSSYRYTQTLTFQKRSLVVSPRCLAMPVRMLPFISLEFYIVLTSQKTYPGEGLSMTRKKQR